MATSAILKAIQDKIDLHNKENLYLEGYKDEACFPDLTLKEFILKFLTKYTLNCETINSKTKELWCPPSNRRSITDIYRLCKHYYTNVTLEEVMTCLSHLDKEKKIGYFYCLRTETRVWMEYNFWKGHTVNPVKYHEPDEYGITEEIIKELSNLKY